MILMHKRRIGSFKLSFFLLLLSLSFNTFAAPSTPSTPHRVLLLHAYHQGFEWTDEITKGVMAILGREKVEVDVAYMDTKRVFDEEVLAQFATFLQRKHKMRDYDLIITSDNNAFNFVKGNKAALFGQIPHVFCGVNYVTPADLSGIPNCTGVNENADIAGNLALIKRLHPNSDRIWIITDDTPTGQRIQKEVDRLRSQEVNSEISLSIIHDVSASELVEQLQNIAPSDIILLSIFFRDRKGQFFEYDTQASMITQAARAPVYACWEFHLKHGVVGGLLTSGYEQGRAAAKQALSILNGRATEDVPVLYDSPTRLIFDYNAMQAHDISLASLPDHARVLDRPPTFFKKHGNLIWQAGLVILLLSITLGAVSYGLIHSRRATYRTRAIAENLRVTLQSIGDAVIVTDLNGIITGINPVALNLIGCNSEAAKDHHFNTILKLVDARTGEQAENPVDRVLETGEAMSLANHIALISEAGHEYQIADSAAPIKDNIGRMTGVVLVFRDITQEYERKAALAEQKRRLDYILNGTNVGTWEWNVQTGEIILNERWAEIAGYTLTDLSPTSIKTWTDLAHPEDLKKSNDLLSACFDCKEEFYHFECRMKHRNGNWVWVLDRGKVATWTEDGKPEWMYGTHQDITERKRAEEQLRESEARYRMLFHHAAEGIVLANMQTSQMEYVNPAMCRILGYTENELKTMKAESVHPKEVTEELHKYFHAEQQMTATDFPCLRKDGTIIYCDVSSGRVTFRGNEYRIGLFTDTTERKQAELERERMQRLEGLGKIAGGIAHDFNNLLMGIFGNLQIAQHKLNNSSPAFQYLKNAFESIEYAKSLTSQLLTFSEGGTPIIEDVDTKRLLTETTEFNLHGAKVAPHFDLPDGLWHIKADKGQIRQAIANLVINAKQAMPEGGSIYVSAKNLEQTEGNRQKVDADEFVRICIRDEGAGIAPNIVDRIFDPYYTTKKDGHGLGLAMVHSIIKRHGGSINVDATPDRGTSFYVTVPATPSAKLQLKGPNSQEFETEPASNLRILLMDDDAMLRRLGTEMLERMGHTVEVVADGDTAINVFSDAVEEGIPFDLVIVDLTIPDGKGGKETVGTLLQIEPTAKIIVASGYSSDDIMANYKAYGFCSALVKPFTIETLEREISRALNRENNEGVT